MVYQCIYCKASYEHSQSYKHNAYDCPKQKGKAMKASMVAVLSLCMAGLTGCEYLDKYFPKQSVTQGGDKANITVFKGDKSFTYSCDIDTVSGKFTNCAEVK